MSEEIVVPVFPAQLLNWAGNRSGGVRRPFDEGSGRPASGGRGNGIFGTNLLVRLESWCKQIGKGITAPRLILLVGGPGNGKTEAIENTLAWLDDALGCGGSLVDVLSSKFRPVVGMVPRVISVDAGGHATPSREGLDLSIVQDATVRTAEKSAAELLLEELEGALSEGSKGLYLCCVNRGVLDDALILAAENDRGTSRALLEKITRAVSLLPDAPRCWPLSDHPEIAVWPMDMESLLVENDDGSPPAAYSILERATDQQLWPAHGACVAGSRCPFCTSREQLSHARERSALLEILRWYELASGKRWSFRDLFSLFSYLLAGHRHNSRGSDVDPCAWAASMANLDELAVRRSKATVKTSTAIFELVMAQYHQALFHSWERSAGSALLKDLKDLDLQDDNTAMGLQWFLSSRRSPYLPAMIEGVLESLSALIDPALAAPETTVEVSRNTSFLFKEIDMRFSRSVSEGLEYVRKPRILTALEVDLLKRLAELDTSLSKQDVRRKRPATATRVQRLVRDFSCRLVRRSIGVRTAAVLDAPVLKHFQEIVEEKDDDGVFEVAREIEGLLNKEKGFEVSLTTTFGQPLPPSNVKALLVVPKRNVQPANIDTEGRPRPPLRFIEVGEGKSIQEVALTYELFKAVKDIMRGMSASSLPRSVLALLDTTGARLAGPIVRDESVLRRAELHLGNGVIIEQRRSSFGLVTGGRRK